jgi:hypothetical protein
MIRYLYKYPGVFDMAEVRILTAALNIAWTTVEASGVRYAMGDNAEPSRAALAKHIIEAAMQGERDQRRLSEGARVSLAEAHKG